MYGLEDRNEFGLKPINKLDQLFEDIAKDERESLHDGQMLIHLGYEYQGYGPGIDKIQNVTVNATEMHIKDALRVIQDFLADTVTYYLEEEDRLAIITKDCTIRWKSTEKPW